MSLGQNPNSFWSSGLHGHHLSQYDLDQKDRQVYNKYNPIGLGMNVNDIEKAVRDLGLSDTSAQHAQWLADFNRSGKATVSWDQFQDMIKYHAKPIVPVRAPVYVAPVYVAPVRHVQRTFLGPPPSVDPFLLKDLNHGGHHHDHGNGFRSAMSELECLEQDEEARLREILNGLRGLGMSQFNGAPDILQQMVNYCMQMRNEHDTLVSCNKALSDQNRALIGVVNDFDGKIQQANSIIYSLRDRLTNLQAKYDNLENAYNRLKAEEEAKRHYLEGVLNKTAIKIAEYKQEAEHHIREESRLHSHYGGQLGSMKNAHDSLKDQVRALTQQRGLDINLQQYIGGQYAPVMDIRAAQELLIVEGHTDDSQGNAYFESTQARQIAKQMVMLSCSHGTHAHDGNIGRDASAVVDANWSNLSQYFDNSGHLTGQNIRGFFEYVMNNMRLE